MQTNDFYIHRSIQPRPDNLHPSRVNVIGSPFSPRLSPAAHPHSEPYVAQTSVKQEQKME